MTVIALEYHDVVDSHDRDASGFPGAAAASYKLDRENFRLHLDRLAACGSRVGAAAEAAIADPDTTHVLLTFDDGGASARTVIGPELSARGWCAHVFIPTDRIGTRGFLGNDDLRALRGEGHVIGSHSASHPMRMSHLRPQELREEWRRSVGVLTDLLGEPAPVASVPGGYYDDRVAEAAAEAGIRLLFTSEPVTRIHRVSSCAVMGRFTLRRGHQANAVGALVGSSPLARQGQWLSWNARKLVKRVAGEAYLRLREARFGRAGK